MRPVETLPQRPSYEHTLILIQLHKAFNTGVRCKAAGVAVTVSSYLSDSTERSSTLLLSINLVISDRAPQTMPRLVCVLSARRWQRKWLPIMADVRADVAEGLNDDTGYHADTSPLKTVNGER